MKSNSALLACTAFLALTSNAGAFQMLTTRVSVDSLGAQGNADSGGYSSISADGHFVVFSSVATNLVAGDTNASIDIFVRDRQGGITERVNVAAGGAQANKNSESPSISADGRFVAFSSLATNLVAGDTNSHSDIFVHDRASGTTELVSVSTSGVQGNYDSHTASISADGRFVAFESRASVLVAGDSNGSSDIFVRDRLNGTTERVSVSTGGAQATYDSYIASISGDGRFVAFSSEAWNLVAGDTNGRHDIFVRDRLNGTTERVSVSTAGVQAYGQCFYPSISADGRWIAFVSRSSNLVVSDTNGKFDVFLHDCQSGATERVSVDTLGVEATDDSAGTPSVSANGRLVAFRSFASNLVAADTNGFEDVFVHDRGAPPPAVYCTSGATTSGCSPSITASENPSVSHANACILTVTSVEGLKWGLVFYGIDNSAFTPAPWASGSTSFLCVKPPTQRTPLQNSGGSFAACDGSFVFDWNAHQSANPLALGNPWHVDSKVHAQAWFRDPLAAKSTNLSNALEMTYVP